MADGLITVDELREIFDIDTQIKDERFERALVAAGRRMREWVGDEAYDDALLPVPVDETRQQALEFAEAHVTMGYAILGINTALRREGVVRTERVEGSAVLTYHSPAEIARLQQEYFEQAELIARPYLINDGTVVGLSSVMASTQCEAVTRSCGCPTTVNCGCC